MLRPVFASSERVRVSGTPAVDLRVEDVDTGSEERLHETPAAHAGTVFDRAAAPPWRCGNWPQEVNTFSSEISVRGVGCSSTGRQSGSGRPLSLETKCKWQTFDCG